MNAMNEQAWYCVPKGLHTHERSDHAVAAQLTNIIGAQIKPMITPYNAVLIFNAKFFNA